MKKSKTKSKVLKHTTVPVIDKRESTGGPPDMAAEKDPLLFFCVETLVRYEKDKRSVKGVVSEIGRTPGRPNPSELSITMEYFAPDEVPLEIPIGLKMYVVLAPRAFDARRIAMTHFNCDWSQVRMKAMHGKGPIPPGAVLLYKSRDTGDITARES